jgi:hypothetical protein
MNGKYATGHKKSFGIAYRNTDIPGTRKAKDFRVDGTDELVGDDANYNVTKRQLTLCYVDMDRQKNELKQKKIKLEDSVRHPDSYKLDSVRQGFHMQSNIKQDKSFVPFDKLAPRTKKYSIYEEVPDRNPKNFLIPKHLLA